MAVGCPTSLFRCLISRLCDELKISRIFVRKEYQWTKITSVNNIAVIDWKSRVYVAKRLRDICRAPSHRWWQIKIKESVRLIEWGWAGRSLRKKKYNSSACKDQTSCITVLQTWQAPSYGYIAKATPGLRPRYKNIIYSVYNRMLCLRDYHLR